MQHQDYYEKLVFDGDINSLFSPDKEYSLDVFNKIGLSNKESLDYYESGFWATPSAEGVIFDRLYGGALMRLDNRTRFHSKHFLDFMSTNKPRIRVKDVNSIAELKSHIAQLENKSSKPLLFRGQTQNYVLNRSKKNPAFVIPSIGEISLLPSVWRKVLGSNFDVHHEFQNLPVSLWLDIFSDHFDMVDIDLRIRKMAENDEFIFTNSDMEDCSDPVVADYGKLRMDLFMGHQYNLATGLMTLLQHYGLYSPMLDLTSELDIALFFATHKLNKSKEKSIYNFCGTNERKAVIYVSRENITEMEMFARDRVFETLDPQRPVKQKCHVCRSGPLAMNLPLDFVTDMIILNFDMHKQHIIQTSDIFPDDQNDNFLKALKRRLPTILREAVIDI